MNKIKKLYKEFFGIREQTEKGSITIPKKDLALAADLAADGADIIVGEAQLINKITDYQGGVEWVITDPTLAKHVMVDISTWAKKKGFTIITRKITKQGKIGYIYFRLGEDPAKESHRIQGYVAQMPEIKYFRFKVRNQPPARTEHPQQPTI